MLLSEEVPNNGLMLLLTSLTQHVNNNEDNMYLN